GLMLNAIAAVFLGMTMSEQGEPRILATVIGVLIIGVLDNGLTPMSVDSYIRQILVGGIIVLAVAASSITKPAARGTSLAACRLRLDLARLKRGGARHQQRLALGPADGEVAHPLGRDQLADHHPGGIVDMEPVLGAHPEIAERIDPQPGELFRR